MEHKLWNKAEFVALITLHSKSKVGGKSTDPPRTAGFLLQKDSDYWLVTVGHFVPENYDENLYEFGAAFKNQPETYYRVRPVERFSDPDIAFFVITDPNFQFSGEVGKLNPDLPKAGERVYVLGHPFGLSYAVSEAKIFAPSCSILQIKSNLFCHVPANDFNDLHVAPGSSGGPILNQNGEIIGMHMGAISDLEIGKKPAAFGLAVPASEISKKLLELSQKK